MIAHCSLHFWMSDSDPLSPFLPFALVELTTAVIFGVHRPNFFPVTTKVSSNTNPSQKEQINETDLSPSVA